MITLIELPFFFKSHSDNLNGGFPQVFPFHLFYDNNLLMFRQKASPGLNQMLSDVYKVGSLAEGSISSESGMVYVDQVVKYITRNFPVSSVTKILEVGHGSGIIMRELKKATGARLTGIEPGNHALVPGLEDIKLVHDFFPSEQVTEKFDLVFSLMVLEHIEDPVMFVTDLGKQLLPSGKIILAVPNCEPYMDNGDLSILIHEHFSYFTKESILQLVHLAGFYTEDISIIEGAFIFTISRTGDGTPIPFEHHPPDKFLDTIESHVAQLKKFFQSYADDKIAVYAPVRALNSLFLCGRTGIRLADDNSEMHHRYLPVLKRKVESFNDLVENPPECILIFSRTFGDKIKLKCSREKAFEKTKIMSLPDLEHGI